MGDNSKGIILSSGSVFTPASTYDEVKAAEYMARLLRADHVYTTASDFYQYISALSLRLKPILQAVLSDLRHAGNNIEVSKAINFARDATNWSESMLERDFNDLAPEHPVTRPLIVSHCLSVCENISKKHAKDTKNYELAQEHFKNIFGLTSTAYKVLEMIYVTSPHYFLDYLRDIMKIWSPKERKILSCALGDTATEVTNAIDELKSCQLIEENEYHSGRTEFEVTGAAQRIFDFPEEEPGEFFCGSLRGDILPLDTFSIDRDDLEHIKRLLTSDTEAPIHIIIYGPPGTGKTTFARSLAHELGLRAWTANTMEDDAHRDRTSSVVACLNIVRRNKGTFVVVDEAEKILDTSITENDDAKDKSWLNILLEKPNQRVIWITNHVDHIHPAVLRRFTFSIFFGSPGRKEREKLLTGIISRHNAENYFTPPKVKALAKNYEVPAAVIENSIRQAEFLGCNKSDFAPSVERSMKAYTTLMRGGQKILHRAGDEVKGFTLEGVTLDGGAVSDLMERCRRADEAMRDANFELEGGCATMLFYGPPGTGKTALARHIAHELDRECIIKRGSDLKAPYVGETEQKIAEAFRNAEEEGAVLVIDEADTFLFSREMAAHSWEVSFVNEFLVNLEECRTFCICTTNRLKELDQASVRRFAYKIEFDYSGTHQVMALYEALLAPLCTVKLSKKHERLLKSLNRLTPGDFHAVRQQYNSFLSDAPTATHDGMIEALRREMSMKHEKASAGFRF